MFAFLKSSHKWQYICIAFKCMCSPDYVYRVAHGKESNSEKLDKVRKMLLKKGIIHRQVNG